MIIDAHAYVGAGVHLSASAEDLLRSMDEAQIDKAVICPVDRFLAVENQQGNDTVLNAADTYPDRFLAMACANPWFGDSAVLELKRVFEAGAVGLFIHPGYQGFRLSDPIVYPILDVAHQYGAPVYAHTGTAGIAEPFHVMLLAERYPSLQFIMGHGGSPDYGEDAVIVLDHVPNVWIETSRNGPANSNFWKVRGKKDRVLFGSSFPEYFHATETATLRDVFTEEDDRDSIFFRAAQTVFAGRL